MAGTVQIHMHKEEICLTFIPCEVPTTPDGFWDGDLYILWVKLAVCKPSQCCNRMPVVAQSGMSGCLAKHIGQSLMCNYLCCIVACAVVGLDISAGPKGCFWHIKYENFRPGFTSTGAFAAKGLQESQAPVSQI